MRGEKLKHLILKKCLMHFVVVTAAGPKLEPQVVRDSIGSPGTEKFLSPSCVDKFLLSQDSPSPLP